MVNETERKIINKHKATFKRLLTTEEDLKRVLETTLKKIKFLESIYTTGMEWNLFSEEFKESAYKERQILCLESSALYSILRENYDFKG